MKRLGRERDSPSRERELKLHDDGYVAVACVDEVGRGAIAGPVFIGIVVVARCMPDPPNGIRDSKLLSANVREKLAPGIREWAQCTSTGDASAREIDRLGIMGALALATQRGLAKLEIAPQVVLLDGKINFLSEIDTPPVFTQVKGDLNCFGIAAASIIAKVTRDAVMCGLNAQTPGYGWNRNKGYASVEHIKALNKLGVSPEHRRSWKLPGANKV